jgi:hypothetical protein
MILGATGLSALGGAIDAHAAATTPGRRTHEPGGWFSGFVTAMPRLDSEAEDIWFTDDDRDFFVVKPTVGTGSAM